jgi:flagellar biosynthesis chaperone FliJ
MFGYKGDLTDQAAVEEWAKHTAHKIAIENGYVDPITGEEIRVRDIGKPGGEDNPAYVLVNSSSGKILVREFFNNQPTHGEGVLNYYEYLWRPKFSENMLENQSSSTLESASQSLTPVEEFRPVTPPPEMNIPDTLAQVPSFSKEELVDLMSKTFLPKMEYTLDNFKGLSLLEQEHILSQIQNDVAPHMNILKNYGDLLTPQEQEIMSNVNKLWGEMVHSYTENYNDFIETLMKRTSLNTKNLNSFLSLDVERALRDFTTSDGIFGKAVELLRKAKPTYEEIVNKVPVGHILKSRFAGDFNF